jgi:hypothetical protein
MPSREIVQKSKLADKFVEMAESAGVKLHDFQSFRFEED